MRLILVRHGEALDSTQDPTRPLSRHGQAQVRELGLKLLSAAFKPQSIYHSGILEAQQSAQILHNFFDPAVTLNTGPHLKPSSDIGYWKEELENFDNDLMLVGHMPFMGILAGELSLTPTGFETANAIVFERPTESDSPFRWKMIWNSQELN